MGIREDTTDMKLQTILTAARNSMLVADAKRAPHCYSSFIQGRGYVGKAGDPGYAESLKRSVQSEIDNMGFAPAYAEPGYTDPKKGILFANWNLFPREIDRVLERAGFECEWSDEWSTCNDCGKAVRTQGDSYGWTSYYRILNECELICLDCLDPEEYLKSIEDNANAAVPPQEKFNPLLHGYVQHNGKFETGFHQHMNDDPKKILKALQAEGKTGVVFRIAENSQFYTTWEAFHKP